MTLDAFAWVTSLAIGALYIAVTNARLRKLRRARSDTERKYDDARAQVAALSGALADRDRRSEQSRLNSIQRVENQIAAVKDGGVSLHPRPVMNKGETAVFYAAKSALERKNRNGWHVFAQVSLGEIIGTESVSEYRADRAHQSINSKRCDILIADQKGSPIAIIEFQGSGHYQGNARQRDLVKRIAAERAGIAFIEIQDGLGRERVRDVIAGAI